MNDLEQRMKKKLAEAELLGIQFQTYELLLIKNAIELAIENGIKINYVRPDSIIPKDPNSINVFIDINGNVQIIEKIRN